MVYKGRTRLETKKNRNIIVITETEKENEEALSILSRWTGVDVLITPEILFKGAKL